MKFQKWKHFPFSEFEIWPRQSVPIIDNSQMCISNSELQILIFTSIPHTHKPQHFSNWIQNPVFLSCFLTQWTASAPTYFLKPEIMSPKKIPLPHLHAELVPVLSILLLKSLSSRLLLPNITSTFSVQITSTSYLGYLNQLPTFLSPTLNIHSQCNNPIILTLPYL